MRGQRTAVHLDLLIGAVELFLVQAARYLPFQPHRVEVLLCDLIYSLAFSHTSEYKWYAPSERFQGFDLAVRALNHPQQRRPILAEIIPQ